MDWKDLSWDIYKAAAIGGLLFLTKWLSKKIIKFATYVKKIWVTIADLDSQKKEIKELSDRLFLADQQRQAIFHLSINPMFMMNTEGDLVYVNPAWCKMLGFSDPEDAYGMGFMRAIPDSDIKKITALNEQQIKHPSNYEGIVRFRHIENDTEIMCKCRTEILYNELDEVTQTIGILEIISSS